MSITNKFDTRMLSLVLIALIGGVIGGYLSNATIKDTKIESLSNAFIAQLDSKDTEIASLSDTMSNLEKQFSQLEASIADSENVPVIGFNTPDFDSGWIDLEQVMNVQIKHNLGTTNLFVYLIGGYTTNDIHQLDYGSDTYLRKRWDSEGTMWFEEVEHGAQWNTYGENEIHIHRNRDDMNWHRFRVLLWVLPDPPVLMIPVN